MALDEPLKDLGLHSERVLWEGKGPGKFEQEVAGLERIRYTTSHPLEFTQRLIDAYAKLPPARPAKNSGTRL